MDSVEILVHIAAPGMVKDDKIYLAQARSVLSFEPAWRTRGLDCEVDEEVGEDEVPASSGMDDSFPTSLDGWSGLYMTTPKHTPAHLRAARLLKNEVVVLGSGRLALPGSNSQREAARADPVARDFPRRSSSSYQNPPYRKPLPQQAQPPSTIQAARTPDVQRPKTAPAATFSHDRVPETILGSHKRAWSDTSICVSSKIPHLGQLSFESAIRAVPGSHPEPLTDATSFNGSGSTTEPLSSLAPDNLRPGVGVDTKPSIVTPSRGHGPGKGQHILDSLPEGRAAKRALDSSGSSTELLSSSGQSLERTGAAKRGANVSESDAAAYNRPTKRRRYTETITSRSGSVTDETPLNSKCQPKSLEHLGSSSPRVPLTDPASSSLASTETPSQMTPGAMPPSTSPSRRPAADQNAPSPIDLISQELAPQLSSPPPRVLATCPPPAPRLPRVDAESDEALYPSFSQMPTSIIPKPPVTGDAAFKTHITEYLGWLDLRYPSEKHFRPEHVARDVAVLERGHWHLPVTILPEEVVGELRDERPHAEDINRQYELAVGKSEAEKKAIATNKSLSLRQREGWRLWTEKEFMEFWTRLQESVRLGKLGIAVSVYRLPPRRDEIATAYPHSPEVKAKMAQALLLVSTWGEVISHIYMHLWAMSNKKIEWQPLEWRDGGDDVVIRMSGERKKGGRLGRYIYKGLIGHGQGNERGVWGLAPYSKE